MALKKKDIKALDYILKQNLAGREFIMNNLHALMDHGYEAAKETIDCELYYKRITQEEYDCALCFIEAIKD